MSAAAAAAAEKTDETNTAQQIDSKTETILEKYKYLVSIATHSEAFTNQIQ